MRNLLILFFLFGCSTLLGQITFYKQFSNNGYDYGEGITQMADSSYFITGSSSSFFEGPAQAFILKLDSLGNFKWSKHFGGSESDGGKRIMHIENDGLLVAGFTNSSGLGAYDFYLFKTDLNGFLLWENTYGTSSWDRVYDAALTRDSGVIMVGETLNTTDGESDILIVRTDKNGNELWSQQIGNEGADLISCISQINDSTFALGGKVFVADSMMHKAYICKMDENGIIWWEDTLDLEGNSQLNGICYSDPKIACVGETQFLNDEIYPINYKCDLLGVPEINSVIPVIPVNKLKGITNFGNTSWYAVAMSYDNQYSYGGYDLDIQQYYPSLDYEESLGEVHSAQNVFYGQIGSTNDDGAVMVGHFENIGLGGSNVFVMKINKDVPGFNPSTILNFESLVDVDEFENEVNATIFPNPANVEFSIKTEINSLAQIVIQDFSGRIIYSEDLVVTSKIDVRNFAAGSYFVTVSIENEPIIYKKLVIAK